MNNKFWAVYNKKMKVVSISKDKITAQEEALRKSKHRWTYDTFKKDWGYLEKDGFKILESIINYGNIKIRHVYQKGNH